MTSHTIALLLALAAQAPDSTTLSEHVPGTVITLTLQRVPAGVETPAFWITATEIPWDLYDVFVFSLERGSIPAGVDAVARPSRPYVLPGESFGHASRPALGMTMHAARTFATWLSVLTGHRYRIPSAAEWMQACLTGAPPADAVWHAGNANARTHPVGALAADANGVHDLLGNAAEWVDALGDSLIAGGSFQDPAGDITCATRRPQRPFWNMTDPQLPKSRWWLSDAPFVGLRLVRDP